MSDLKTAQIFICGLSLDQYPQISSLKSTPRQNWQIFLWQPMNQKWDKVSTTKEVIKCMHPHLSYFLHSLSLKQSVQRHLLFSWPLYRNEERPDEYSFQSGPLVLPGKHWFPLPHKLICCFLPCIWETTAGHASLTEELQWKGSARKGDHHGPKTVRRNKPSISQQITRISWGMYSFFGVGHKQTSKITC